MALDINKCVKAATMPIAVTVLLSLVNLLVFRLSLDLVVFVCIVFFLVMFQSVILGWAGFIAVKQYGMGLMGGAVTGVITTLVSLIICRVFGFFLGFGPSLATVAAGGVEAGMSAGVANALVIITVVVSIIFGIVFSAVMGAIGAFVAQMKK